MYNIPNVASNKCHYNIMQLIFLSMKTANKHAILLEYLTEHKNCFPILKQKPSYLGSDNFANPVLWKMNIKYLF